MIRWKTTGRTKHGENKTYEIKSSNGRLKYVEESVYIRVREQELLNKARHKMSRQCGKTDTSFDMLKYSAKSGRNIDKNLKFFVEEEEVKEELSLEDKLVEYCDDKEKL